MEHLDDCIYPSVWDDSSPLSDETGLRKDVVEALRQLSVPVVRWPGGCFADIYHWEDGVGPRTKRPVRRNWNWGGLESNQFGTDEFINWCRQIGAEPYINVNLGSGTLVEALRWIDYCNGTLESQDVLNRKANGRAEPYGVKYWGIGNETWSSWEVGQMDADSYARTLKNWLHFIQQNEPDAELLAVGSSGGRDPSWDRKVLETAGNQFHYLTTHLYAYSVDREQGKEYYPIVFSPVYFRQSLEQMLKTVDECELRTDREMRLAMDEWNIRHFVQVGENNYRLLRNSPRNLQDALFAAGILNMMIQLSPRIGMANYVFLINSNGVMNVSPSRIVKSPLFYVFQQYARWMQGTAVESVVNSPECIAPLPQLNHPLRRSHYPPKKVGYLDSAAACHDDGTLVLSLINRHQSESMHVKLVLPDGYGAKEQWTLHHSNIYAANDMTNPDQVIPVTERIQEKVETIACPAHSLILVRCTRNGDE